MTKESVKNFVKDHKTEIIYGTITAIGVVALAVVGVKTGKDLHAKKDSMLNDDKLFIDLVNTVDEASAGCKQYVKLALPEIAAVIAKGDVTRDLVKDSEGNLLKVKSVIAFGNVVEQ